MSIGFGRSLKGGLHGSHRRAKSEHKSVQTQRRLLVLRDFDSVEVLGRKLLAKLPPEEAAANHQRIIAIDVDSKRHFVADSIVEAMRSAKAEDPGARLYIAKIGVGHVYKLAR